MEKKEPFIHNEFSYTENGIGYPSDIKFPLHFFKYYSLNNNSIDCFINEYLYFSHPNQLNDILDCKEVSLDFKNCTENEYYGFLKHLCSQYNLDTISILSYEQAKKDDFYELKKLIYYSKFSNKGILSLTTNPLIS